MPEHQPPGIIVVDDDSGLRRFLAFYLSSRGFTPHVAGDAQEALALLRLHKASVRLALLGVTMPEGGGPAVLRLLREESPGLRFCFMTGGSARYSTQDLLALGAEHVFDKPFGPGEPAASLHALARP